MVLVNCDSADVGISADGGNMKRQRKMGIYTDQYHLDAALEAFGFAHWRHGRRGTMPVLLADYAFEQYQSKRHSDYLEFLRLLSRRVTHGNEVLKTHLLSIADDGVIRLVPRTSTLKSRPAMQGMWVCEGAAYSE